MVSGTAVTFTDPATYVKVYLVLAAAEQVEGYEPTGEAAMAVVEQVGSVESAATVSPLTKPL